MARVKVKTPKKHIVYMEFHNYLGDVTEVDDIAIFYSANRATQYEAWCKQNEDDKFVTYGIRVV